MCEVKTKSNKTQTTKSTKRRRGVALIYGIAMMSTMCGLASIAADYGRVQLTKSELRATADAAARAGAGGLGAVNPRSTAIGNAIEYAARNSVDTSPVVLDPTADIQIGLWQNNTFTTLAANSTITPNAVHVTLHRSQARGNAVPLIFGKILGSNFCDVSADSIAEYIPAIDVNQNVLATANPFLSGTTAGTAASIINPHGTVDYAGTSSNPMNSPIAVNIPLSPNAPLTFDSISGTARHDPHMSDYEPDGETDNVGHDNLTTQESGDYASTWGDENGIADMNCPINALVGVFLDDNDPRLSATPTEHRDFSTDASRDFTTLQPKLKQMFFIGDGLTSDGKTQSFVPPAGATRLYLATWDFYEWNNNSGQRTVQVERPSKIITVR